MIFNKLKKLRNNNNKKKENKINPSFSVIGSYLHIDKTELISEKFVKRYNVNSNILIEPFGYFDERNGSILLNINKGYFPDGTYILIGVISYPGEIGLNYYNIPQFNLVKSRGIDLRFAAKPQPYPNLPKNPNIIKPVFPLFKVGNTADYKKAKKIYTNLMKKHWTIDKLKDKIATLSENSLEDTIYKFRLALQRNLEKEKLNGY